MLIGMQDIEPSLRRFFAANGAGIAAAYLFGSVATGKAKEASDVDVAVLFAGPAKDSLLGAPLGLEGELERLLERPVQVIAMNSAPVDLVHEVLRDGRLLFEADRVARIEFEVNARNAYFDLLPILLRYRRSTSVPA